MAHGGHGRWSFVKGGAGHFGVAIGVTGHCLGTGIATFGLSLSAWPDPPLPVPVSACSPRHLRQDIPGGDLSLPTSQGRQFEGTGGEVLQAITLSGPAPLRMGGWRLELSQEKMPVARCCRMRGS